MLKPFITTALSFVLLSAVLSSTIWAADNDKTREKARIVTSISKPVECISPISIYSIDDQLVGKNEMGFDLEPGKHSLVGTVSSFGDCPRMRTSASVDVPALEYEFKAGKTYYIGLHHKSSNQQNWRFVVWRIEDENGISTDVVVE